MKRTSERGSTLVLVTVMIIAFLALTAIAVDLGMLYTARTSAQHAADAAALAAAYDFTNPCALPTPPTTGCESWPGVETAAKQSAVAVAAQNTILKDPVALSPEDVNVDIANQRVTVTVRRTGANAIGTFFARALGFKQVDVLAHATAEVASTATGTPAGDSSYCLKPIFLPNTILSSQPTVQAACDANEIIFDSTTGQITNWASAKLGTQTLIRPTTPSVTREGLAPSQFYSLDFGNGTDPATGLEIGGASMYRCTLGHCLNQCGAPDLLSCGSSQQVTAIDVETGNMVGPTTEGINTLIGNPPTDTYSDFVSRGPSATSVNLAVAPVWDSCHQPVRSGTNVNIKVLGFVKIFIDNVVQSGSTRGDTTAHVLGPIECGDVNGGGTTPPPGTPGPYTVPIRLVQAPAQ